MTKGLLPLAARTLVACCLAEACIACTVFVVVRDGEVLFANNEDFDKPGHYWVTPGDGEKLGRINFGFGDGRVQGSMNEAGLAFDGMALAKVPWEPDAAKETPRSVMDLVMDSCRSVAEAVEALKSYNGSFLADSQVLLADATGDAALISWVPGDGLSVKRIAGDRLIGTNHRQPLTGYRCQRYVRADQVIDSLTEYTPSSVATVLDAVRQEGPQAYTTYSTVYDLKKRQVTVYNLADFGEPVVLDLASEVSQAEQPKQGLKSRLTRVLTLGRSGSKVATIPLRRLFPDGRTESELTGRPQRTTFGTTIDLPAAHLDRCVGTYSPPDDPRARFCIERQGNRLVVDNPAQADKAILVPESPNYFRIQPDRGAVSFVLGDGDDSKATGLVLHKQIDLRAVRVSD
ncbi:MAG: hypothetical protein AAFV43_16675 [Planctomycetota bacterium]